MDSFKKIGVFFRQHWLALILAIVVGLISIASHLLTINALGDEYKGIPFFSANDNVWYTAQIREVLDGHGRVNSPYFFEYKNQSSLVLPIGEFFYALPSKLFNLSAPQAVLISKFLFPLVLFFLVYLLISRLTKEADSIINRINAMAGGLFVTLGYDLIDFKTAWPYIFGQIKSVNLLLWTRPVNPITGALLFFIFLILLWKVINNGQRWLVLPTGLVWGLMIGYFFSWSLSLAVIAVLLAIFVLKKNYSVVKNLLLVCLIFFLAGLPYWLNIFSSLDSIGGRERAVKNGMFFTHQPMFNKVLLFCLFIFLPCFIYEYLQKRKNKEKMAQWWWFCLSLLLGGLLALNQQVITGRTVWPYHFVQYTIPSSMVAMVVLFYNFVRPKLFRIWLIGVLGIIFSALILSITMARNYAYGVEDMRRMQRYGDILEWLDNNTQKDCVVLVGEDQDLTTLIPAFSHCNDYATRWFALSMVPGERVHHNYLASLRIKGVGTEDVEDYLKEHQEEFRENFFTDWNVIFGKGDKNYIEEKTKQIILDYKEFSKKDFTEALKRYRLDYILAEGDLDQEVKEDLPQLQFINNFNGVFLYKF